VEVNQNESPLAAFNYRELSPPIWRSFSRQGGRNGKRRIHKLGNAPSLVSHAHRLRWCRAKGFMNAAEIVVCDIQRDRCNVPTPSQRAAMTSICFPRESAFMRAQSR